MSERQRGGYPAEPRVVPERPAPQAPERTTSTETEQGYRGPQVCKIVGITYRQLDYWARTDLVRPSVMDAAGSGTQRLYSFRDLLELKVIKQMLDAGIALQSARKAVESLRGFNKDLASARIVIDGSSVILAETEEQFLDLMKDGQGVLSFVPLAPVVKSVSDAVQLTFETA